MKILGVGTDIIDNRRIKFLIKKKLFISRTFSVSEINNSKKNSNKINYFAKRFAAKESFAKAVGTGFRKSLNFKDIEILNKKNGKPYFLITNKIDKIIFKEFKVKKYKLFLSISDEKEYSIAFALIQGI